MGEGRHLYVEAIYKRPGAIRDLQGHTLQAQQGLACWAVLRRCRRIHNLNLLGRAAAVLELISCSDVIRGGEGVDHLRELAKTVDDGAEARQCLYLHMRCSDERMLRRALILHVTCRGWGFVTGSAEVRF